MTLPLPSDELERLQALARYQVLDTLPEETFDRITRLVVQALGVQVAAVNLVSEDRQWSKACSGASHLNIEREFSFCARTIVSDEVYVVPNAHDDEQFRDTPFVTGGPRIHLYAGAPLITPEGYRIGSLCVTNDTAMPFGEREQKILQEFAAVVMDELELRLKRHELEREARAREQMMQDLRRTTQYAQTLLAVSELVNLGLEPQEMTRRVIELIARAPDLDWGGLLSVHGDSADILTAWTGPGASNRTTEQLTLAMRRGEGVTWQVLDRGEALFLEEYDAHPNARPAWLAAGVRAAALVPLGTFGGIEFVFAGLRFGLRRVWSKHERSLFTAAARNVTLTLERREHLSRLHEAAFTDPLTGLANRQAMMGGLHDLLKRNDAFTLVLIDLDHMKRWNQNAGYERGDAVLREFASVLSTALHSADRAFSLGGDEFALLLRHTGEHASPGDARGEAVSRVEQVVNVMRRRGFEDFSVSVGVASCPSEGCGGLELLRLADSHLYEFKRTRDTS